MELPAPDRIAEVAQTVGLPSLGEILEHARELWLDEANPPDNATTPLDAPITTPGWRLDNSLAPRVTYHAVTSAGLISLSYLGGHLVQVVEYSEPVQNFVRYAQKIDGWYYPILNIYNYRLNGARFEVIIYQPGVEPLIQITYTPRYVKVDRGGRSRIENWQCP